MWFHGTARICNNSTRIALLWNVLWLVVSWCGSLLLRLTAYGSLAQDLTTLRILEIVQHA